MTDGSTSPFAGFRPDALRFLRALAANNRREWFEAHRVDFETMVRAPMRALVEEMDVRLATTAPELVGDPRRSIFRLHRDTRFSADKSPYKTHASFWLAHRDGGRPGAGDADGGAHGGAGLYFHLEPRASFIAAGIWMPPAPVLARLRTASGADPRGFARVVATLERRFAPLDTDRMLTRLPRGFAETHPGARWLRYTSFTASHPLRTTELRQADLPDRLMRLYRGALPFVRWLNRAIGLPPATRR